MNSNKWKAVISGTILIIGMSMSNLTSLQM